MEMFESGELAELLGVEQPDLAEAPDEPEHELPQRQAASGSRTVWARRSRPARRRRAA